MAQGVAGYFRLRGYIGGALLCGLAAGFSGAAYAVQVDAADISGSFDTTLSYAASMRVGKPDPGLIGIANGGTARSVNGDDGNLNYRRGDFISSLFKIDEEVELHRDNLSFFARGNYFYDMQAVQDRQNFGSAGRQRLEHHAKLLDLFISANFNPGGHALNLRVGNQVINWGESTFIPNGLNVINTVDVTRLRQPGAQLKDALLPTPALQVSLSLTQDLSFSGFALLRFDPVILDPRGAYFSTTDFAGDDGDRIVVSYGRRNDGHHVATAPPADAEVYIQRGNNRRPSRLGQFGTSLHYIVPALGDTELGFYCLRYDSHRPLLSTLKQDVAKAGAGSSAGNNSARYFLEYPAAINVIGGSFNSSLPYGIALQGEYTYRPNLPIQLPGPDLAQSALGLSSELAPNPADIPLGAEIRGYRRVAAHQLQFTLNKLIPHAVLGSDQLLVLGEFGADYLELPAGLKFSGPGVVLPSRAQDAAGANGSYQHTGFATRFSWGYRLLGRLRYLDVFHAINLSPQLAYSSDVSGVGPSFNQGAQAVTTSLAFDYLHRWHADLAYTTFFGGRHYSGTDTTATASQPLTYSTSANSLRDRDFVAVSISYAF